MYYIIKQVETHRIKQGLSKSELCRLAGIKESIYYKYLKDTTPSIKAVVNLMGALGFNLTWSIE